MNKAEINHKKITGVYRRMEKNSYLYNIWKNIDKIIQMNEKFKTGEEGILEQASYLLENKGVDFVFISRKTKKRYKLKLVEDEKD